MYKKILCLICIMCMLLPAAMGEEEAIELPVDEAGIVELTEEEVESDEEELIVSEAIKTEYASASDDFPDVAFRAYILSHFDINRNGEISSSEAKKVTKIDVSGLDVTSLSGIEKFTKQKQLFCNDTSIQSVELGYCSALLKYVKESAPRIVEGSMVFEHSKKIVATMPVGTAITDKGKAFFDPALGFSLSEHEKLLTEKQKHTLLASGACGYPPAYCRFVVSDKNILKISGGTVTAQKAGTATVTVTTFDGLTDSCVYEVKKAPSKVTLSKKSLTLGAGQQFVLEASVASNCYAEYSWSSDNKKVATVEGGLVTAHTAGMAKITVKTQNGKKATCELKVYAAPTSIALNADSLNLMTGQSAKLKATLNTGAGGEVRYYSDAPGIAAVDSSGAVTAVSEGRALIFAETYNGLIAACEVNVMAGPERIAMNDVKVYLGETAEIGAVALTADGRDVTALLSYASSDVKVASVAADGRVSGVKIGSATITATAPNGKKATCKVTVVAPTTSIKLDRASLKLKYDEDAGTGDAYPLKATLNSGAFSAVTYESDAEDVAIVNDAGLVTAVGVGSATITARTDNGLTAVCAVTVAAKVKFPTGQTIVVAHRGGKSCGPENTLEAFANTAGTGAEMIELDVRTTKDKVLVINHDPKIKGKTIKDKKYSELRKLKPDLCTLDQALDVIYESGLLLQVELKDTANVEMTVSAVSAHHMEDRVIYISFEKPLLRKVRALDADARLGFIFMDAIPAGLDSFIDELDISALMVHKKLLTRSRLDGWHDRGLQVNVWTIDSYDECAGWISMGVDYITSNYPEVAVRARG